MEQRGTALSPGPINVGQGERIGSLLLGTTLLIGGLGRASPWGIVAALGGGALLYRGATGHCALRQALEERAHRPVAQRLAGAPEAATVERSLTLAGSPAELYAFWRNPSNLSRIMSAVVKVEALSEARTHWQLTGPLGRTLEWDTSLMEDRPGEYLAWRSDENAPFANEGSVRFQHAPGDRGTVVTLRFQFDPPGGPLGDVIARALEGVPATLAREVLRRFKSLVEAGEIPTLERNPSARRTSLVRRGVQALSGGDGHARAMLERS
jgi:uncharacterized membrane protein